MDSSVLIGFPLYMGIIPLLSYVFFLLVLESDSELAPSLLFSLTFVIWQFDMFAVHLSIHDRSVPSSSKVFPSNKHHPLPQDPLKPSFRLFSAYPRPLGLSICLLEAHPPHTLPPLQQSLSKDLTKHRPRSHTSSPPPNFPETL
jgi:hypothetical protein